MSLTDEFRDAIAERVRVYPSETVRIIQTNPSGNGSGMPWIFDFRAIILEPKWLNAYAEIFWEKYADRLPFQVAGLETAGIPLVAAIVMKGVERGTPVNGFFIRKSRKREGLLKAIEGTLTKEPVILVDDLINSGWSFNRQVDILGDVGARVSNVFALLAFRAPEAYEALHKKNIGVDYIFTLEDIGMPLERENLPAKLNEFEIVWRKSYTPPSFEYVAQKSAPIIDEKNIYAGTDAGVFHALDQATGTRVWSFSIEKHPPGKGIFSCPALHEGVVYFGAYDGNVYALDAASGALKWKYSEADWVGSSPMLAPNLGLLFIGLEFGLWRKHGGIVALDMRTGKRAWIDRTPALTHGSPLYIPEENMVVIGSNDGVAYAYDVKTGTRKWTYQCGSDIKTRPAYDAARRLVLVPSMDSTLYALSARDGSPQWGFTAGGGIYSNPLVHGDVVYVASLDKSLYAIDLESGKKRAEHETRGRIFASPVLADESLWIGSNDGGLCELDPETLKRRGYFQATERIVNAISYNEKTNRFFVPTVAGEIYCFKRVRV